MHSLKRVIPLPKLSLFPSSSSLNPRIQRILLSTTTKKPPSLSTGEDEWNDAWETAWLPNDPSATASTADVTFSSSADVATALSLSDVDADTKAFVAEMDERWTERRAAAEISSSSLPKSKSKLKEKEEKKKDVDEYRLKKQRIHAGLWMKEIEKMEEAKIGRDSDSNSAATGDDIDRLLDSCSEIFDSGNIDMNDSKIPSTDEFKSKPDGWETTSKSQGGNIWEISQREEDILLQEFERRIAFSKFQIASFIKSHIFSRRRPIDGWKYMIEELGPNARRGKGSVPPGLVDPSTQPYKEQKPAITSNFNSYRGK